MAEIKDIKKLNASAIYAMDLYQTDFESFLDILGKSCDKAIRYVLSIKIDKNSYDINELKKTINLNAGTGINLIDLVFLFLPIAGGHIFEKVAKSFFKNKIATRYTTDQTFKKLTKERGVIVKEMTSIDKSSTTYSFWSAEFKRLSGLIDTVKGDYRETGEFLNKLLEFSSPVVNDYLQELGQLVFKKTGHSTLSMFKNFDSTKLVAYKDYNERVIQRYQDAPAEIVDTFLNDALLKEKENLKYEIALQKFLIDTNLNEEFAEEVANTYMNKQNDLLTSSDLSLFKLYFEEALEAIIWIIILGDPSKWAAQKDPETNDFYTKGASKRLYREYYIQSNVEYRIREHLLSTFHPFPFHQDTEISKLNYLEYFEKMKEESLGSGWEDGVVYKQNFAHGEYDYGKSEYVPTPDPGDPIDINNKYYTYEESAWVYLSRDFTRKYFQQSLNLSPYFKSVIDKHKF
ncbi:MAG: hypothetical protein WAT71_06665 [Ignavibacteria bacterium]